LNLSAQQQSQMEALREEYRGKREALNAQFESDMKKILTPEQVASLESMNRDRFNKDREGKRYGKKDKHSKNGKSKRGGKGKHRGGARMNQLDDKSKQEIAHLRMDYEEKKAAIEKSRVAPETQKEQLSALREQYKKGVLDVVNTNSAKNQNRGDKVVERPHSVDAWMGIAPENN